MTIRADLDHVKGLAEFYETLAIFHQGRAPIGTDEYKIDKTLLALEFLEDLLTMIYTPPLSLYEYQLFLERLIDMADNILQQRSWDRWDRDKTIDDYTWIGYDQFQTTREFNDVVMSNLHSLESVPFCGRHHGEIVYLLQCYIPYIGHCNLPRINNILRKEAYAMYGPHHALQDATDDLEYENDYRMVGCNIAHVNELSKFVVDTFLKEVERIPAPPARPAYPPQLPRNYRDWSDFWDTRHRERTKRNKKEEEEDPSNPFDTVIGLLGEDGRDCLERPKQETWGGVYGTRVRHLLATSDGSREVKDVELANNPFSQLINMSQQSPEQRHLVRDAIFIYQRGSVGNYNIGEVLEFVGMFSQFRPEEKFYLKFLAGPALHLFVNPAQAFKRMHKKDIGEVRTSINKRGIDKYKEIYYTPTRSRKLGPPRSKTSQRQTDSRKPGSFKTLTRDTPVIRLPGAPFSTRYGMVDGRKRYIKNKLKQSKKYKKTMKQKIKKRRSHKRPRVSKKI